VSVSLASARRRTAPILLALLLSAGLAAAVFSRLDFRTDMADFLPQGRSEATRFMLREIRTGEAARLILIGIEGAAPDRLAEASRTMAAALSRSGRFAFVEDGGGDDEGAEQFLFRHRYLLSPATTPEAFTTASLRHDLEGLLEALASSAAPLAARYGVEDPPGAFLAAVRGWIGASPVQTRDGVWFAADRPRALILAKTDAAGVDLDAQRQVRAAIDRAWEAARPEGGRLLLAGPAIFTLQASQAISGDVRLIAIVSTLLIVLLLVWRFRSPWVIAAIGVPILLSVTAAALAVQCVFGSVHGVTLGFGLTMLGVSLDYPVLLIGHRRQGEAIPGTMRRIGRTLALTVVAAVLGLTGMLFSSFPGLSQLGLFSVVGLAVAALATRFALAPLIVAADIAPVSTAVPDWLLRLERLRLRRGWFLALPGAALLVLAWTGGPMWETKLARLSPVPRAALALDAELRAEIGAPEVGRLAVVSGADAQTVLQREEDLAPLLDGLVRKGVLLGAEMASRTLPSARTQLARIAALPDAEVLAARMQEAAAGLPFRPDAFRGFAEAVAVERAMRPLGPADITDPRLAARLQPLLFERDGAWYGLIAPAGLRDPAAFAAAVRGQPGTAVIDMQAETDALVAAYTGQALRWLGFGVLAALAALAAGLRSPGRLVRVLAPIAGAVCLTLAVLALARVRLSLFHVVALQLMVGVGLDYALFFARRGLDEDERARTFRTLATCAAMTLLSFGLLAFCRTPLLRGIGLTVAVGVIGSIFLAFLFAGPRPGEAT